MTTLTQLQHSGQGRRVALVDGRTLRILDGPRSVYELARQALSTGTPLSRAIEDAPGDDAVSYDDVYEGRSEWRLLPAFDHPEEPARCLVSGTGLTHKRSAANRNAMHEKEPKVTDSILMYEWGVAGGCPSPGTIGVQPEWFYKGNGTILRAHGEPLVTPNFAEDGGDEAEIAGVYVIDDKGAPRRVGMVAGNEFSDHRMERRNYLYLAPSKLRTCAVGPELVVDAEFGMVKGRVRIERGGEAIWDKEIATGEARMAHSLENLEHHHFKYPAHRRPGDAHIHFFGADAFSFGEGITLEDGDVMSVAFEGFGRALRNPVRIERGEQELVRVGRV